MKNDDNKILDLPPFYVGQELVAIKDHEDGYFKKGDEFNVITIQKSNCKCPGWDVSVGLLCRTVMQHCSVCMSMDLETQSGFALFHSTNFAPKLPAYEFVSMKEVVQLETIGAN